MYATHSKENVAPSKSKMRVVQLNGRDAKSNGSVSKLSIRLRKKNVALVELIFSPVKINFAP